MPIITVEMWEGRSDDQKRQLVRAFTQAMVKYGGTTPEALTIIFHDMPRNCWGHGGILSADIPANSPEPESPVGHMPRLEGSAHAAKQTPTKQRTARPRKNKRRGGH